MKSCIAIMLMLLLTPAFPASSVEPAGTIRSKIIGVWEGMVTEGKARYMLVMEIAQLKAGARAGTTSYSGRIRCGGALTYVRRSGRRYVFTEVIDTGSGCADGRIEVTLATDGTLRFRWYRNEEHGGPAATATLVRRVDEPHPR